MADLNPVIQHFSPTNLTAYFCSKIPSFRPVNELLDQYLKMKVEDEFSCLEKLGEITFESTDELLLISCKYSGELTSRSSKKKQYEIARSVLKGELKDAAIFAFYDNAGKFRFSFIRTNYTAGKRDFSTWKRYTYFVIPEKPNKTFRNQINKCDFSSVEKILKAFSIDVVTDDFYNAFKQEYDKIANNVKGDVSFGIKQDFTLLFVIRTIFIGFVQKRKWLGDDEEFLQNYWKEYKKQYYTRDQFYLRWMVPLLFEALNSPPGREVQYSNNEFSRETRLALKMAPFLNGELFKPKQRLIR